jgi:hypothetical protein
MGAKEVKSRKKRNSRRKNLPDFKPDKTRENVDIAF